MPQSRQSIAFYAMILGSVLVAAATALADIPTAGLASGTLSSPFFEREVPSVASNDMEVSFRAADSGGEVSQVDLWVTTDRGTTWTKYASQRTGSLPTDRGASSKQSRSVAMSEQLGASANSISFHSDGEGLFGFYLVLHNAAGASSPPPSSGTAPQQWARVDLSSPIAKILSVRTADDFAANREVTIRWEVLDDNLTERPVTVYARTEQSRMYRPIAELQAAASEFRWQVPRSVAGRVEIKIAATDRAGHKARAIFDDLHIVAPPVLASDGPARRNSEDDEADKDISGREKESGGKTAGIGIDSAFVGPVIGENNAPITAHGEPDAGSQRVDPVTAEDARKQYELATWHRLRGEGDVAIVRYRKALEYDPKFSAARHDLAALLLLKGSVNEAEAELERLLSDDPDHQQGLKTLALVQSRQRNYRSAAATLQRLLLLAPEDAEAWLSFGDVALFMGDREQARVAWAKIDSIASASPEHRRKAEKRLELYRDASVGAQVQAAR